MNFWGAPFRRYLVKYVRREFATFPVRLPPPPPAPALPIFPVRHWGAMLHLCICLPSHKPLWQQPPCCFHGNRDDDAHWSWHCPNLTPPPLPSNTSSPSPSPDHGCSALSRQQRAALLQAVAPLPKLETVALKWKRSEPINGLRWIYAYRVHRGGDPAESRRERLQWRKWMSQAWLVFCGL